MDRTYLVGELTHALWRASMEENEAPVASLKEADAMYFIRSINIHRRLRYYKRIDKTEKTEKLLHIHNCVMPLNPMRLLSSHFVYTELLGKVACVLALLGCARHIFGL